MADLVKVVEQVRDDLKDLYLENQSAVWTRPFVAIVQTDGPAFLDNANSEAAIVEWLKHFRGPNQIKGVVVGRMVAKHSKHARDAEGNPIIMEKAILVTGRMLDTAQTYVTITSCREHSDLRNHVHDEPRKDRIEIPGLKSPDKVSAILGPNGEIRGFKEMQFGKEKVFDSRRGVRCMLDPIISGIIGPENIASA
jgi:hypothetical protein